MNETVVESSTKAILDLNEKVRVLHVDDDSGFLKISKQCLETEPSIQVDTALSVEEAFKKMEKGKFDIIVSDYQMPEKDGLDFLKTLRSKGNTIPFIIFTGKGREEIAIKALNLGASQYINKTGDTETVYAELAHSIRGLAKIRKIEEKQAESARALKESEAKYRELVDRLPEMVFELDINAKVAFGNKRAFELTGYSEQDVKEGLDANLLVAPEDLERSKKNMRTMFSGNMRQSNEYVFVKKDGTRFPVSLSSAPIVRDGKIVGARGIVIDISERKKAEQALEKSEAELKAQFYGSPDLIMILDKMHRYVQINRTHFLSYDVGKLIGKNAIDVLPPNERQLAEKMVDQCFETGKIQEFEHTLRNGEWIRARVVPLRVDGTLDQVMIISTNVTESRRAEQEVKESAKKYRELADSLPEIVFEADDQGKVTFANKRAFELSGYSQEDFKKGLTIFDFFAFEEQERVKENFGKRLQGESGRGTEYLFKRKDGSTYPVFVTSDPVFREGSVTGIRGIAMDISNLKETRTR